MFQHYAVIKHGPLSSRISDWSAYKCLEGTDDTFLYNEVEHVAVLHNNRKLHSNVNERVFHAVTPGWNMASQIQLIILAPPFGKS